MIWSTAIDGAVPAHNMRIEGDNIIIDNKMDSEYKYAILTDELNADDCDGLIIMVSKDGKNFCIALAVEIDGKSLTTVELCIRMCPGWFRNELQKQILQSANQEGRMIAIDMPIPNNCDECPCEHDAACYAAGWRNPNLYDYKGRPEQCPLIDISKYEDDCK